MNNFFWIPIIWSIGCAPSLEEEWKWSNKDEASTDLFEYDTGTNNGELQTVFNTQINATDHDEWVMIDLETGNMSTSTNITEHEEWDLAVRRFIFALNCPLNGPGDVYAQAILDQSFDTFWDIPTDGFVQDEADTNGDGVAEYVLGEWFDYDPSTHILTPRNQFYVIQNRNGNHFKFAIENYYSSAGTSAMITVLWELLDPIDTTAQQ